MAEKNIKFISEKHKAFYMEKMQNAKFKDGDIVKFKDSDKLYAVSGAPNKESLNRTVWNLLYAVVPYELNKEMDLGLENRFCASK